VVVVIVIVPIPLVARYKAYVCGLSLGGTEGLNPAGSWCWSLVNAVCLSDVSAKGRYLVQKILTECGVSVCDIESSTMIRPRSE